MATASPPAPHRSACTVQLGWPEALWPVLGTGQPGGDIVLREQHASVTPMTNSRRLGHPTSYLERPVQPSLTGVSVRLGLTSQGDRTVLTSFRAGAGLPVGRRTSWPVERAPARASVGRTADTLLVDSGVK